MNEKKHYSVALLLSCFFGPLGAIYANWAVSVILVALIFSPVVELYSFVSGERIAFQAYIQTEAYLQNIGIVVMIWIASVLFSVACVFVHNRRASQWQNRLDAEPNIVKKDF